MTKELLAELGSCGDYTRTFRRLFPVENHPDGVEVNEQVCAEHADEFPWSWAVDVMLTPAGYNRYDEVLREITVEYNAIESDFIAKREAWKTKYNQAYFELNYNTSDEARAEYNEIQDERHRKLNDGKLLNNQRVARAFGRVFDTEPEMRSHRIEQAREAVVKRIERDVIQSYEYAKAQLEHIRNTIETLNKELPEIEAKHDELKAKVAPALARRAAAHAELLAARMTEAQERAAIAQREANEAKAEAERLAAEIETPAAANA